MGIIKIVKARRIFESRGNNQAEAQLEEKDDGSREIASMELSMTTAMGLIGEKTLKMLGKVGNREVLVLVDCGATHNFVSESLVSELAIPTETVCCYLVTVADGRRLTSNLKCPEIELEIQEQKIRQPFYPFKLSDVDLVLGVEWLESLGEIRMNWRQLYMKFRIDDRWVCLRGNPAFTQSQGSYHSLKKDMRIEGGRYIMKLWVAAMEEDPTRPGVDEEMMAILNDWEHYAKLTGEVGGQVQIVDDDLLVTNPKRVEKAIKEKSCNALLLKVNQIGSVTESIEAVKMSKRAGWGVMASHRSWETEDTFIADLSWQPDKSRLELLAGQRGLLSTTSF